MSLIIIILAVAYILIPLVYLTINERMRSAVKIVIYLLTLIVTAYLLIAGRVV
jgi:hypothetical protein